MKKTCSFLLFFTLGCMMLWAQSKEDSLLVKLQRETVDSNRVKILNDLFKANYYSDPEKAQTYVEQALEIALESDYKRGIARCKSNLGVVYRKKGDYVKALIYNQEAYQIEKELGNLWGIAKGLHNMGGVYFMMGDFPKALEYYEKAREAHEARKDTTRAATIINDIGTVYNTLGNHAKAQVFYLEALEILEKQDVPKMVAMSLGNLGQVCLEQDFFDEAAGYFVRALKIYDDLNDKFGRVDGLNNLGDAYAGKTEYDSSQVFYKQALELARKINFKGGEAYSLNAIADAHRNTENFNAALKNYNASLKLYEEMGSLHGQAIVLNNLGHLYLGQDNYGVAISYLERSLERTLQLRTGRYTRDNYEMLALAHHGLNDYKNAYEYQQKFMEVRDSISGEETRRAIAEKQIAYEADVKEREIKELKLQQERDRLEIARSDAQQMLLIGGLSIAVIFGLLIFLRYRQNVKINRKIEQKNKEIQAQRDVVEKQNQQIKEINTSLEKIVDERTANLRTVNKELDTFLYQSAHALRSPLTQVKGLLGLILSEKDPVQISQMNEKLNVAVSGMDKMLHKLIMVNETVREAPDYSAVAFAPLVQEVWQDLETGIVELDLQVPADLRVHSDPYLLKIMMQNLLENAVSYHKATSDGPAYVRVNAENTPGGCKITIADNGIGIPQEQIPKIFQMFLRVTEKARGTGLGLYVVKKVLEKLRGTVDVQSLPGEGTTFEILLPNP